MEATCQASVVRHLDVFAFLVDAMAQHSIYDCVLLVLMAFELVLCIVPGLLQGIGPYLLSGGEDWAPAGDSGL